MKDYDKLTNPEARENRHQFDVACTIISALESALNTIRVLYGDLEKLNEEPTPELKNLRSVLVNQINSVNKKRNQLYKDYWYRIVANCDHDYQYEGESYGGNYDIYVCTKL